MYENIDKMQYTPMMRQYLEIKEQYPDTLVFFRLGDFYEMFFNDAIVASKVLEIVLTGRDAGSTERVPMCGVPYHAVNAYLDRLTEKGFKVAIVEQTEDPALAKGIVTREVVRIVTPGTTTEGSLVEAKENNYLTSIDVDKDRYLLCYSDLGTGENYLTDLPLNEDLLTMEVLKLKTREIVIGDDFPIHLLDQLKTYYPITISQENNLTSVNYLKALTEDLDKTEEKAFLRLLNYIIRTQKRNLIHMQKVVKYDSSGFMKIDFASRRNLEILETLRFQNKKNSLVNVLDHCVTAMGSRFLKKALIFPLIDREKIEKRYGIVEKCQQEFLVASELRGYLENVYDLERIVGKIAYDSANPKDLLQLRKSLGVIPNVQTLIKKIKIHQYFNLSDHLNVYSDLFALLDRSISLDAPFVVKDGGVIKDGYHEELDSFRQLISESKDFLLTLEEKERERTGIRNLRVGFNRVFGYYLEVSKGNSAMVQQEMGYIRKQTLSNVERFITEELKDKESMILRAEEKALELEIKIFQEIRDKAKETIGSLQFLAKNLSELDMLLSFVKVANENHYVRPKLIEKQVIDLKGSRHPVIEKFQDSFIPNDVVMKENERILLITGPNMSGKSTYMRQIALIAIMAQIGSFVPCTSAKLPIFDAIFTRIGAADDIVSGQSTFMIEMQEVNNALKQATENSLIIFDEIGRGTATYDGMALAQAIIEYLHEQKACKTFFSTHYHELTTLDKDLEHLRNIHVSAEEVHGDVVFLHKVLPGPVDKSYGINVAKLAKIPLDVILRATDILKKLENHHKIDSKTLSIKNYQQPMLYDSKSEKEVYALEQLKTMDINKLSPIEAMNKLDEIQKILKK
ncbi:MAG: DNA mismatch repair protein MutS [Bacilli bacterium]